jgi:general secretion pathway protein G
MVMVSRERTRAFTLIELLLVLVILAVLASVSIPVYSGYVGRAKRDGTLAEISSLKSALSHFEMDNSRYPTTEEGLYALVQAPAGLDATWNGPYIEAVNEDKFGHPYGYASPGVDDPTYDLASAGADGTFGTADDITKFGYKQ